VLRRTNSDRKRWRRSPGVGTVAISESRHGAGPGSNPSPNLPYLEKTPMNSFNKRPVAAHRMWCACAACNTRNVPILAASASGGCAPKVTVSAHKTLQGLGSTDAVVTRRSTTTVAPEGREAATLPQFSDRPQYLGRPAANEYAMVSPEPGIGVEHRAPTTAMLIRSLVGQVYWPQDARATHRKAFKSMFRDLNEHIFTPPILRPRLEMNWLDLPLSDLRPSHIESHVRASMLVMARSSVIQRLRALHHLYEFAHANYAMDIDVGLMEVCRRMLRAMPSGRLSRDQVEFILRGVQQQTGTRGHPSVGSPRWSVFPPKGSLGKTGSY